MRLGGIQPVAENQCQALGGDGRGIVGVVEFDALVALVYDRRRDRQQLIGHLRGERVLFAFDVGVEQREQDAGLALAGGGRGGQVQVARALGLFEMQVGVAGGRQRIGGQRHAAALEIDEQVARFGHAHPIAQHHQAIEFGGDGGARRRGIDRVGVRGQRAFGRGEALGAAIHRDLALAPLDHPAAAIVPQAAHLVTGKQGRRRLDTLQRQLRQPGVAQHQHTASRGVAILRCDRENLLVQRRRTQCIAPGLEHQPECACQRQARCGEAPTVTRQVGARVRFGLGQAIGIASGQHHAGVRFNVRGIAQGGLRIRRKGDVGMAGLACRARERLQCIGRGRKAGRVHHRPPAHRLFVPAGPMQQRDVVVHKARVPGLERDQLIHARQRRLDLALACRAYQRLVCRVARGQVAARLRHAVATDEHQRYRQCTTHAVQGLISAGGLHAISGARARAFPPGMSRRCGMLRTSRLNS